MFVFSYDGKADNESYYLLQKANVKNSGRARSAVLIRRVLLIAAGLLLLRSLVRLLLAGPVGGTGTFVLVFGIVVCLTAFAYGLFYLRLSARRAVLMANRNSGGAGELRFEDGQISSVNGNSSNTIEYSAIQAIYHKGDFFFLFISENRAVIANLRKLTDGDPAEFEAFLRDRTGKEIQAL